MTTLTQTFIPGLYLFIGGNLDKQSYWTDNTTVTAGTQIYTYLKIIGQTKTFGVFMLSDLDIDEVLKRLICRYESKPNLPSKIIK